jgi:ribA/ribD-fused uncharacterized protein
MSVACHLQDLLSAKAAGRPLSFVFFPDNGMLHDPPTAGCLSQWAITPFQSKGMQFFSAEQAMMHGKAVLFGDLDTAARILACRTPFQAKNLGRQVAGFSEDLWERERFEVVVSANLPKFAGIPALRAFLSGTGDSILVEASPVDLVWGNGLEESHPFARDPSRWPGMNLLGFALMEVRKRLRRDFDPN